VLDVETDEPVVDANSGMREADRYISVSETGALGTSPRTQPMHPGCPDPVAFRLCRTIRLLSNAQHSISLTRRIERGRLARTTLCTSSSSATTAYRRLLLIRGGR
jgi:hypothetical protein